MNKLTQEINLVLVCDEPINLDNLNRTEIKDILGNGFDQPPKYIEIPGTAIFDYSTNPDFPVQLNIEGRRIVFVLNGNTSLSLDNEDNLKKFSTTFQNIIKLDTLTKYTENVTALGMNTALSITADSEERPFNNILSTIDGVLPNEGGIIARGIKLHRKNENRRMSVDLDPIIPEMGQEFTESYLLKINIHIQPVGNSWKEDIQKELLGFKNKVDEVIEELNK